MLIHFYTWLWLSRFLLRWRWRLWVDVSMPWCRYISFSFLMFLHLDIQRILLSKLCMLSMLPIILFSCRYSLIIVNFFRNIIIVTVFSSIFSTSLSWIRSIDILTTVSWISFRSVSLNRWLIILSLIFHYFYWLIVVVVISFLIGYLSWFWGRFRIGLIVIFFFDISLCSIISFIFWPSKREGTRSTRCLNYFFVSFSLEISIISYIFIEHQSEIDFTNLYLTKIM